MNNQWWRLALLVAVCIVIAISGLKCSQTEEITEKDNKVEKVVKNHWEYDISKLVPELLDYLKRLAK